MENVTKMFGLRRFQKKKYQKPAEDIVADEIKQHPSSHKNVTATTAPVSATCAEAGKQRKTKKVHWRKWLFGHPEKKETNWKEYVEGKESTCDTTLKAEATEPNPKSKKTSWWRRLFRCCKRRHGVSSAASSERVEKKEDEKKIEKENRSCNPPAPKETNEQEQSSSFSHQDEVVLLNTIVEESLGLSGGEPEICGDVTALPECETSMVQVLLSEQINSSMHHDGDQRTIDHLGFPNIGQSCYMNSILQSLLTLEDFVQDISRQEEDWSSVPEAQLMRAFMSIRDAHASTDVQRKTHLLCSFKKVVSGQALEFMDCQQKDAHEFLTLILMQIMSLSPLLQETASNMSRRYTCPVEDHLVFKMENTRTCRRCGAQSKIQEEFTNLSLDLIHGGSVEQMLEKYLMETELEYKCECGGNASSQRLAFETLPRVLIFHIKRFRFTPSFGLVKVRDPVVLLRELVVSSNQGRGCYSLVSAISHFGETGDSGHYICDSVHPDDQLDEPTDRWLTFNDTVASETTGASICRQRQDSAYILFYKKETGVEQSLEWCDAPEQPDPEVKMDGAGT